MGVESFSLGISSQTTGTAEIEKLVAALNGYVTKVEEVKKRTEASAPSSAGFEKFADGVKNAIQNPLSAAGDAAKGFATTLGPVGMAITAITGIAGSFAVAGFEAAKGLGELGTQIHNVSLRTGLTTKEVGQFSFAAKMAGQDVGIFETAMRKLSAGLSDAGEDGKKAKEGLALLGVQARDVNGNLKPTSEIFMQISEGMTHIGNASDRTNALVKIFGRLATELIPTLAGLNENIEKAKELGLGLTDEQLEKFEKYHGEVVQIEAAWDKLKRNVKEGIVGTISLLFESSRLDPYLNPMQVWGDSDPSLDRSGIHSAAGRMSGLATQGMQRAQNAPTIARGQALIDQLTAARGPEVKLSGAKSAQSAAWDALQQASGTGEENVRAKAKAYDEATAAVNKYEAAVKGMRKAEEDAKKVTETLLEIHKAANVGESPYMRQAQSWLEKTSGMSMTSGQSKSFNADLTRIMLQESGTEWDKLLKEYWKVGEEAEKHFAETVKKDWEEVFKPVDDSMARRASAAVGFGKEGINFRYGNELSGAQHGTRLATALFSATSTSQTAGIEFGYAQQMALASQTYEIEHRRMEELLRFEPAETQALKRQTDDLNLKADLQKSMDDARVEREIAYAELQRQNLDKYKEGVGQAFDALVASGHGGIQSMFQSLLLSTGRQIAMNAGGELFQKAGGNLGKIGGMFPGGDKLLKGTLFDPANQALISNTAATVANTAAIQAMRFGAPGVTSAGGFSGSGWTGGGGASAANGGWEGSGDASTTDDFGNAATDAYGNPGNAPSYSVQGIPTSSKSNMSRYLAGGAALAGGAFAAYDGFSRGGARGGIEGAGGVAGAASGIMMLAGVTVPAAPIVAAIGMGLGMIAGLFGDPKASRAHDLSRQADMHRYTMPTGTAYSVDSYGRSVDSDMNGQPRIQVNQYLSAFDAKSLLDRAPEIHEMMRDGVNNYSPLKLAIQGAVNS